MNNHSITPESVHSMTFKLYRAKHSQVKGLIPVEDAIVPLTVPATVSVK